MESGIRKPAVSGIFYPSKSEQLARDLKNFLDKSKKIVPSKTKIKALIVPHAGLIYSGYTAARAYKQLPLKLKPANFILIGPSHHYYFKGIAQSRAKCWETPLGKVTHKTIHCKNKDILFNDNYHANEHCLEVQIPFLQHLYGKKLTISCFLTGQIDNLENITDELLKYEKDNIFIISSDLSHYLPKKVAEEKDKTTINEILNLDTIYFSQNDNTACGSTGITILLEMAKKKNWKRKMVYYDTSATYSYNVLSVVGYTSIIFYV